MDSAWGWYSVTGPHTGETQSGAFLRTGNTKACLGVDRRSPSGSESPEQEMDIRGICKTEVKAQRATRSKWCWGQRNHKSYPFGNTEKQKATALLLFTC